MPEGEEKDQMQVVDSAGEDASPCIVVETKSVRRSRAVPPTVETSLLHGLNVHNPYTSLAIVELYGEGQQSASSSNHGTHRLVPLTCISFIPERDTQYAALIAHATLCPEPCDASIE